MGGAPRTTAEEGLARLLTDSEPQLVHASMDQPRAWCTHKHLKTGADSQEDDFIAEASTIQNHPVALRDQGHGSSGGGATVHWGRPVPDNAGSAQALLTDGDGSRHVLYWGVAINVGVQREIFRLNENGLEATSIALMAFGAESGSAEAAFAACGATPRWRRHEK